MGQKRGDYFIKKRKSFSKPKLVIISKLPITTTKIFLHAPALARISLTCAAEEEEEEEEEALLIASAEYTSHEYDKHPSLS